MKLDVHTSCSGSQTHRVENVPATARNVQDPKRSPAFALRTQRPDLMPYAHRAERNAIDSTQRMQRMDVLLTLQRRIVHEFGLATPDRKIRRRQAERVYQCRQRSLNLPVPGA